MRDKLTPKIVGDVLEITLGRRVPMTPYGFELCRTATPPRARLRCGSGIAGHGATWGLVQLPEGTPITMGINTRPKLVRAILEFMAGPPPQRLSEYTVPRARRVINPHTRAVRFVWYRQIRKRPKSRATLVPFGAAQR